jgi:hypothetical protein
MSDPFDDAQASHPDPSEESKNQSLKSEADPSSGNSDAGVLLVKTPSTRNKLRTGNFSQSSTEESSISPEENYPTVTTPGYAQPEGLPSKAPLAMVETAFLASTASLIWLINYYFPSRTLAADVFPSADRFSLPAMGKPGILDGGTGFRVVAVGADGANPQHSLFHPLWSHGCPAGSLVETPSQLGIFNFHRDAAWHVWILFSVLAALDSLGRRPLGLRDDSDYRVDQSGGL